MRNTNIFRWVFSEELPSAQQSGHSVYHPSDNATKMSGYSWSISYGDGSNARGDVYRDTVSIGGITARSQAVEAAQHISRQFLQDQNNDGLLGLAFSSINTGKSDDICHRTLSNTIQCLPEPRPPGSILSSPSSTLPCLR
jgi:hypothetical protein